jgi:hypothetical protein
VGAGAGAGAVPPSPGAELSEASMPSPACRRGTDMGSSAAPSPPSAAGVCAPAGGRRGGAGWWGKTGHLFYEEASAADEARRGVGCEAAAPLRRPTAASGSAERALFAACVAHAHNKGMRRTHTPL